MKLLSITHPAKGLISGLFILITLALTLARAATLSAQPPRQEGDQPAFVGTVQSSPDGSATIESQEARLDLAYFTGHGQLEGLAPVVGGLTLAEGQTVGSYTSPLIYSPLGFTTDIVPLWGVELPEGTALRLETSLSLDGGGSWSDWLENPEAFYPVRDDLHSGNLIWAGGEQVALQFRVVLRTDIIGISPTLNSITITFNDTSRGPTDGEIAGLMADVSLAAGQICPVQKPQIVTRTQWGCPYIRNRRPPIYAPVTHIIIHQTETPNSPNPYNSYAGWVRSIWNFHANILWWGDIGYNYLIDPNGLIYEGRAGGDNVVGIHDGINFGSMGIGFIGCYGNCDDPRLTVAQPTEAMLNSAVELIAWKVSQRGLDPLASSDYGSLENIPTIAGGRDVSWTTSPGDNLYDRLPELRERVAERANCDEAQACQINSIIFGRESYEVGETIAFTVRLVDHEGTPLVGATVTGTVSITPAATISSLGPQASTGFGLEDRAGEYDGSYSDTAVPGLYTFSFLATDPTGDNFTPCSASESISVTGVVTATPTSTATPTGTPPTPTNTPTPTSTPTPTPTPTTTPPAGTVVRITPQNLTLCDAQGVTSVTVDNVSNLAAVQLELRYDPAVVQVVDADPGRTGVQVSAGSAFSSGFIAQNTVNTTTGRISFAATLLAGSSISGNVELISIDWSPVAAGSSALTLENVILVRANSQVISFTLQNGTVQVMASCASVSGFLALQGRTDYSGVIVTNANGQQTQTGPDGAFTIGGAGQLNFSFPGYLSAQADLASGQFSPGGTTEVVTTGTTSLGRLTLLAGDVNADGLIDIIDLVYIAGRYDGSDSLADLNADGRVDIFDLVLAAGNYGQSGPLTAWE